MGKYLLGLDEGTTGCKAVVFDLEGNVIGSDYREYACYYPGPSYVEQSGDELTTAVFEAVKAAIVNSKVDPREIVSMSISSQGATWGPLDKDGKLLRPMFSWQDLRGASQIDKVKELVSAEEYYKITGCTLFPFFSFTKYLWFRENQPELYAKTAIFSTNQDFFLKAFGVEGYWVDSASACRTGVFDADKGVWSEKLFDLFKLDVTKFPKVRKSGEIVGKVNSFAAKQTGLAEGTLIAIGALDCNCSTLGSGLLNDGDAVIVMGTYGSIFVASKEALRDPSGNFFVVNNNGPEHFTMEAGSSTSASSYRWFRDTFCDLEKAAGAVAKMDPYVLMNNALASVAPGSEGITFLPFLQGAAGGRNNTMAKGCFLGATLGSIKAHFTRSVIEGISFEIKDNIESMRKAGVSLKEVKLTGGVTKSKTWNQLQADVYQVPVGILSTAETGCLGAAIYAGVGAKIFENYTDAVERTVSISEVYQPNPANFAAYDKAFNSWKKAYDALDKGGYFEFVSK